VIAQPITANPDCPFFPTGRPDHPGREAADL